MTKKNPKIKLFVLMFVCLSASCSSFDGHIVNEIHGVLL